jgi:hypothetical protein
LGLARDSSYYFDKEKFKSDAQQISYPLHFIDFETTMVAIPFNKGGRPYEQVAFQFSHHTLTEDGTIEHKGQWINTDRGVFPNFNFVRALKKELQNDTGTIFRYANHENTVLCQIRAQLKDSPPSEVSDRNELIEWIESITVPTANSDEKWIPTRPMVDLLEMVIRYFWHPRMGGSNSIKVVLPAILAASKHLQEKYSKPIYGSASGISSKNYKDFSWIRLQSGEPIDPYKLLPRIFDNCERELLDRIYSDDDLADGGAAMMAYSKMQFSEMKEEERAQITQALLRYCELDTMAMVMLWEGWTKLAE